MISVIIPIFDVDDSIYLCLNSILKQTCDDFEIICIDDNSNSSSILTYFSKKDSRIKVFCNEESKGIGYCKNLGIKESSGEYILFLNSNNWLDSNTLEVLLNKSKENELDILMFESILFNNNQFINKSDFLNFNNKYINDIFNPKDLDNEILSEIVSFSFNNFYLKSFLELNSIDFSEKESYFNLISNANKILILDNNFNNSTISDYLSNFGKYLAIDVGGTSIKYSLMDSNAKIFENGNIDSSRNKEDFYYLLDKIILPYLDNIDGIAFSFPGRIDVDEGIAHTGGALSWISDLPLKSILEDKYKKKVWIENDGKCAALAELWKGNLSNCKSGVTIGLGTGIAGGIILDGKLYRGIDGAAGEFSSILENFKDPITAQHLSMIGASRGLIIPYSNLKSINSDDMDGRKFFENYHNEDEDAIKVLNDYAKIIASGIINLQVILNVEKFCIGGGISSQDVLINEIKSVVHDYFENKASKAIKEPIVDRCFFENNAGCVGALYNFLEKENKL